MPTTLTILLASWLAAAAQTGLETVAESSGWQATATHAEVVALLQRLADRSPVLRLGELGTTTEGRSIPLAIIADPPLDTAEAARASGKAIVFAFGCIHGGEVCGKEALLMLAGEIAPHGNNPVLDDVVLVFAPLLNADGNDRMAAGNRPGQDGPVAGMGQRANAQGLDLNRDYVKLESPEIRALVAFVNAWQPHVTIDTHTTNGSRHRYELTWAPPLNPSGHPAPIAWVRDELMRSVTERLRDTTGYDIFPYGNLDDDRTTWSTYSALPRFGGPYRGLRGEMSVLSEAYAYASYKDRVLVTRELVRAIVEHVAANRHRVIDLAMGSRAETIAAGRDPQPDDVVGIRHVIAAFNEPATIKTFRAGEPQVPEDLRVVHLGRFEATRSVRRPRAYLIAPGHDGVVAKLTQHGIEHAPFEGTATVEAWTVTALDRAERPFQGHHLVTAEADAATITRDFPPGTTRVPLDQPLGTLAVYLLEPESEDGFVAWGIVEVAVGAEVGVYRVP